MTVSLGIDANAVMPAGRGEAAGLGCEIAGSGGCAAAAKASLGTTDAQGSWRGVLASLGIKAEDGEAQPAATSSSASGRTVNLVGKQEDGSPACAGAAPTVGADATAEGANLSGRAGQLSTTLAKLYGVQTHPADLPIENRTESNEPASGSEKSAHGVSGGRGKKQEHAPPKSVGGAALFVQGMAVAANPAPAIATPAKEGAVAVQGGSARGKGDAAAAKKAAFADAAGVGVRSHPEGVGKTTNPAETADETRSEISIAATSRKDEFTNPQFSVGAGAHRDDESGRPIELNPVTGANADQGSPNLISTEANLQTDPTRPGAVRGQIGSRIAPVPAGKSIRAAGEVSAQLTHSSPLFAAEREKHADSGHPGIGVTEAAALARDISGVRAATGVHGHSTSAAVGSGEAAGRETFAALDAGSGVEVPRWSHATRFHAEAGFQDPALGWIGVRADVSGSGIHAAIVPGSADAAQTLAGHMAGLGAHLTAQHVAVHTVSVAAPDTGVAGWSGGQSGQQSAQNGERGHEAQGEVAATAATVQRAAAAGNGPGSAGVAAAGATGGMVLRGGEYISVMA